MMPIYFFDTTTDSGTYNQNGRPSNESYPSGDNRSQEVTDLEPSLKNKVVGKAERAFGGNSSTTHSGTDNQYTSDGRPDEAAYQARLRNTHVNPHIKDQIVGKAEQVWGKAERVIDNLKDKL